MAVSDYKVLIAGCGSIGKRHAECLRDIGVKEFVFFDPDPERSRELADLYGRTTVSSYEEGLKGDCDCVYILSPTKLHIKQAFAAANAGKHIFLEKPLSDSSEGVGELGALVEEKGIVAEVGFCFRFHQGIQKLKNLLDEGKIGKLVSVRAMMGEHFPDVRPDYLSTYYVKYSGAFELVHDLDLAIFLANETPIECDGFFGSYSGLGFESPDTVEMIVKFPSCLANVHLDFFQSPRTRTMTVLGTQGQMILTFSTWDEYELRIFSRSTNEWEIIKGETQRNDMFRAESLNFFETIEGRAKNLCPLSEAKKSLIVCENIKNL
ncbi:MAG: Gfo/Idh/MocA family oxidoreductase [Clostridia bacterium]|nr:Gfo/Idh/MocA family oxidoreductase [Clostridia bacterium]